MRANLHFQEYSSHLLNRHYWKLYYVNFKFESHVESKTNIKVYHFLVILVCFTIMYAVEVMYSMISKWRKYCIIMCCGISLLSSAFSDFVLVVWISSWWECLYHINKKCYKSGLICFAECLDLRKWLKNVNSASYTSKYVLFVAVTLWLA